MKINLIIRKWWDPERAIAKINAIGADASLELAEFVATQAREYCPVLSGRLKASIHVVSSADRMVHYVISDVPYAEPVEFGYTHWISKRRIPPQAYMRRAVRDGANMYPRIIGDARVRQGFHRGALMGVEIRAA